SAIRILYFFFCCGLASVSSLNVTTPCVTSRDALGLRAGRTAGRLLGIGCDSITLGAAGAAGGTSNGLIVVVPWTGAATGTAGITCTVASAGESAATSGGTTCNPSVVTIVNDMPSFWMAGTLSWLTTEVQPLSRRNRWLIPSFSS